MNENAISVCMATYNGEKFIKKQLESIIKQIGENDEIIISDDSSSDKTVQIIKSFQDNRIHLIENQQFRNHSRNFQHALSQAKNNIIFLSDQDDIWCDSKVKIVTEQLKYYDLVLTDFAIINENDEILLQSYFSNFPFRAKPGILRNLWRHSFAGHSMAFRKQILNKALPLPKDVTYHDSWIGLIGNIFYKVKFIHHPLTHYRRHANNVSLGAQLISNKSTYEKFKFRWDMIKYIPLLFFR